jgi:VanZ family protein
LTILKTIQQQWKSITVFLLLAITVLSLYPLSKLPEFPGTDKTHHLVAYFCLALPLGLRNPNKRILFIFAFIIFGGIIEMIQPYVNRYDEWLDFFANTIGVIFGVFTGLILNKKLLIKKLVNS